MGGTPPSVRAVGAFATATAASLAVVVPPGAVAGDTLVMVVAASGSGTQSATCSGWVSQRNSTSGTTSIDSVTVLTKTCASDDPGKSYSVATPTSAKRLQVVFSMKDVDASQVLVAVGPGVPDTTQTKTRTADVATGTGHRFVPVLIVSDRASGTVDQLASTTWTFPAGYTQSFSGQTGTSSPSDISIAAAIGSDSAAGAASPSGTYTAQYSNTRGVSIALLFGSATTVAPSLPQVDVLQSGSWVRCNVLGYGQDGVLVPVSVVAGQFAAAPPSAVAPALSADFNNGSIPSWLNIHPGAAVNAAAAYEGAYGARLTRDVNNYASLTSSGTSFPEGHAWASFTMRFKLLNLPDISDSYMNLYEIGNALTAAPKSQHTMYFNAQKLWMDFDASEKIDLGFTADVGVWHRVEARVYFGGTAYTAIVRLDGGSPITFASPANKTPTTADVLWIHYPSTPVDYDMDVDLVGLTTADSDPGWLIG